MKLLRLSAALAVFAILTACGSGDDSQLIQATGQNDLLSHVPDNTPYVVANLEPIPDAVMDSYLEKLQPVADELQAELSQARSELSNEDSDPETRLVGALLEELDGNLNREGLRSLGIELNVRHVMYGDGAFPIFRMELTESETLRATVDRIMVNSGVVYSELTHQGIGYWRVSDETDADPAAGIYISILPEQLVLGVAPLAEESTWLPHFLGIEKPASSQVEARLQALNSDHGYTTHGSGYLDTRLFVDQFLDPGNSLARMLAESGEFDASTVNEACVTEIHAMTDQVPRMIFGLTELEKDVIGSEVRVQMRQSLSDRLLQLAANLPLANEKTTALMELSLGIRVGATRDFLREKAQGIIDAPYQCEHFEELNVQAASLLEKLNQPMPPFVNNFRGLRALITSLPQDEQMTDQAAMIADTRGLLALHVEKPEMLVGMGQMFLPDLATLNLAAGEPPVQLPASIIPFPGVTSFAAMTNHALAISLGEGEEAGLVEFLNADAGPDGVIISASYDAARYARLTNRWAEQMQDSAYAEAENETTTRLSEAVNEAYENMLDRAYMDVRFESDGMVTYSKTTLK